MQSRQFCVEGLAAEISYFAVVFVKAETCPGLGPPLQIAGDIFVGDFLKVRVWFHRGADGHVVSRTSCNQAQKQQQQFLHFATVNMLNLIEKLESLSTHGHGA